MHVVPIRASSPQQIEHRLSGHQAPNLNAYVDSVKCHNNQQLNQLRQLLTTHMTLTRRQGLYITTSYNFMNSYKIIHKEFLCQNKAIRKLKSLSTTFVFTPKDQFCTNQYQFLFQVRVQRLKLHCDLRVVI